jgi:hypothetical protein
MVVVVKGTACSSIERERAIKPAIMVVFESFILFPKSSAARPHL